MALIVEHAMAGKVQQEDITRPLIDEEAGNCPADGPFRLIDHQADLKAPDLRIPQDVGERPDVGVRRHEPRERGVLICAIANDQGQFLTHRPHPAAVNSELSSRLRGRYSCRRYGYWLPSAGF